ncbi:Ubiquitin fusion degradation protein 4, partial [Lunasporangiospora selenospora]
MRQSKMSTNQKRSSPVTKALSPGASDNQGEHEAHTNAPLNEVGKHDEDDEKSLCQAQCSASSQSKVQEGDQDEQLGHKEESEIEHHEDEEEEEPSLDLIDRDTGHSEHDDEDEERDPEEEDEEEDEDEEDEEDEDDDEYSRHHGHADHDGLFSSGGSMSGMVSGMSSRLKGILTNLRAYEDPSIQLIALQDLAVLLSVSTEDTLAGYFSCDSFVKELVLLMRGSGDGDDNPEIMLLACRCLSNLMEAMPASLGSVVYGGAVSVLCSKLIEIQYIDLAEQSLTTLEKISSEYPHAVVREGGLSAVLMFLDFFSTNVQRTAVKTAANCCRGMHQDSISMVKDVLPNLENIIQYPDQKIVEQACLCFVRLADSYKSNAAHLQTIITENILRAVLSLLSPHSNVVVGPQIYTLLLRFLGTIAENSSALGFMLLEMDIVDLLFLILTGLNTPQTCNSSQETLKVPSISTRPKDQLTEIIGVITELLPPLPKDNPLFDTEYKHAKAAKDNKGGDQPTLPTESSSSVSPPPPPPQESVGEDVEMGATPVMSETDKRSELLESHPEHVQHLAKILIPTLIEVYSSTVHFRVRQRAINALVKLVYFTNDIVLKDVLKNVELASFLAVVFSQQEHQSLVVGALQITFILMEKLPSVYRVYFEREGVTFEVSKIACLGAELSLSKGLKKSEPVEEATNGDAAQTIVEEKTEEEVKEKAPTEQVEKGTVSNGSRSGQRLRGLMSDLRNIRERPSGERALSDQLDAIEKELDSTWTQLNTADGSNEQAPMDQYTNGLSQAMDQLRTLHHFMTSGLRSVVAAQKDERTLGSGKTKEWVFERAGIIVKMCKEHEDTLGSIERNDGKSIIAELTRLSDGLRGHDEGADECLREVAVTLTRLGAAGVSSFEFLNSGLPASLLEYLATMTRGTKTQSQDRRTRLFIKEFMAPQAENGEWSSSATPFSILVRKMQEALTRMETFEVEAAQSLIGESRSNPSSSLATQVRLRLSPEDGTEVPPGYQNLVVSIHAIATFRTLDEYLRPRLKPRLSSQDKKSSNNGTAKSSRSGSEIEQEEQNQTTSTTKDTQPRPRRSSRLANLHVDDHCKSDGENCAASDTDLRETKKVEETSYHEHSELSEHSEHSEESEEGDIEEMDYDLDEHAQEEMKPVESTSVHVDTDVAMTDATQDGLSDGAIATPEAGSGSRPHTPSETTPKPSSTVNTKDNISEDPLRTPSPVSSAPWHIQFSLHGVPIDTDTTVYGAIHGYERKHGKSSSSRSSWSTMYPIKYRRVDSPAPKYPTMSTPSSSNSRTDLTFTPQMPKEISQHAEYSPILGLLRLLHGLNEDWRRFYDSEGDQPKQVQHLDVQEFTNSKIAAKVDRQLEEPLIVASSCLPSWTTGLVTGFPFLFPFETRYTYLQSTSFGFSRSIMRWQNQQQRNGQSTVDSREDSQMFLGRIQRQKVRISRQRALESAVRVMDLYGSNQAMLEVEYFEEVGTGLGPTLEFYALVSKEFCKKSLKLWRDDTSSDGNKSEYVAAPYGLYPRPMVQLKDHSENERKILKLFKSLGQFIAKAMLDSRIIDIPLSALLVSQVLGRSFKPTVQVLKDIDPGLARSLQMLQGFVVEKKRIYDCKLPAKERILALKDIEVQGSKLEDMSLDFTLVGYPEVELKPGGSNIPVTIYNVEEYIRLTVDMTIGSGVEAQVAAFRRGFNLVFPIQDLRGFRSEELATLFGAGEEDWSYETLADTIKADHGFRGESRAFKNLLRMMTEFNKDER